MRTITVSPTVVQDSMVQLPTCLQPMPVLVLDLVPQLIHQVDQVIGQVDLVP